MPNERIDIDLSKVGGSIYGANDPGFIQKDARDRVLTALNASEDGEPERRRDASRPIELDVQTRRRHDAILISARRGEGKTTFLHNILRSIEDKTYQEAVGVRNSRKLYSLGMIDPTLIENKQNIIIVIIDLVRLAAEHHRKEMRHGEDEYRKVQKALRKLAQGLTILDGIGDTIYAGRDWVDPDYVLDQGLLNASAAQGFESSFQEFVRTAVDYVGYEAFVLAIDDVDTWFERGWPVLEALRKYLATPELKIILSGDLNLFSLLVRRQQWAQMTDEFLNAETRRGQVEQGSSQVREIGRMIDSLQDQYLTKVAPPEKRIDLRSLEHHAEKSALFFTVDPSDGPVPERLFLQAVSDGLLGLRSGPDAALVRRQILRMPVRSALQTLRGVSSFARSPASDIDDRQWLEAVDALRHVAWTALMSAGVEVNETRDADPDLVFGTLAEWLTRSKLWLPMARFLPDGTHEDLNRVAIYYGALLASTFRRRPARMFDYWLKICTVREKIDEGSVDYETGTSGVSTVDRLVRHLNLSASEATLQTVSRLAAWEAVEGGRGVARRVVPGIRFSGVSVPLDRVKSGGNSERLYGVEFGTAGLDADTFIGLSGKKWSEQKNVLDKLPAAIRGYHERLLDAPWSYEDRFPVYFANGIEDVSNRLNRSACIVMQLPLSRVVGGENAVSANYSFLRLVAVVGALLECAECQDAVDMHTRVTRTLAEASQPRSYPTPAFEGAGTARVSREDGQQDDGEVDEDNPDLKFDDEINVEDALVDWLMAHRGEIRTLAPATLARMWTRFTYAAGNVRSALRHGESRYLGTLMHRTLIVFLHAVGLEAIRAADIQPLSGISRNPVHSSALFLSLLNQVYEGIEYEGFRETAEFAFFDMIFCCPLWAYFFNQPSNGVENADPADMTSESHVFQYYQERVLMRHEYNPAKLAVVYLRSPKGEQVADFFGFHYVLNTVPMYGTFDRDQNVGAELRAMPANVVQVKLRRPTPKPGKSTGPSEADAS